jgi:di/tricarboxylate transporter
MVEETKVKFSIKEIIRGFLDEIKEILKQYLNEAEDAAKKRIRKLLITGIVGSVLLALMISLIGSAALFLLIGSLDYLSLSMPRWEAWVIMGLTSAAIAGALSLVLFVVIRRQLGSKKKS